jgi:predicted nucleic acid-binding protein
MASAGATLVKQRATAPGQAATEAQLAEVQQWLAAQTPEELCLSQWTITEMSSAFSIKLRTGQISLDQRAAMLAAFNRLASESFTVRQVTDANFRTAAAYADQHALGLRAGDALHLAIAGGHGAKMQTLDQRLAAAGPAVGVNAVSFNP